jgi:membrane associated rhomboid family serine protease
LWLWQLLTYPAVGFGPPSLWFLLELLMVFWFGRDVYYQLGRRRFWRLLAGGALAAGAAAVVVDLARAFLTGLDGTYLFSLMQGQRLVLAVLVAAFATLNRDATIYLFFVLPVVARWFLWLELLIAFIGFLQMPPAGMPRDLPGLAGIFVAVGVTYLALTRRGRRRGGLREGRLQLQRWWLERRLDRHRRKSRLRVVRGEEPGQVRKGPWVH